MPLLLVGPDPAGTNGALPSTVPLRPERFRKLVYDPPVGNPDGRASGMRVGFVKQPLEFEDQVWPGERVPRPKRAHRFTPRMRGEHPIGPAGSLECSGSPPHARGTRVLLTIGPAPRAAEQRSPG